MINFFLLAVVRCNQECGGIVPVVAGEVTSPSYPNGYNNSLNCEWQVIANKSGLSLTFLLSEKSIDTNITVYFDSSDIFGIESNGGDNCYDYVKVEFDDGYNENQMFCGLNWTEAFDNSANRIYRNSTFVTNSSFTVIFRSDSFRLPKTFSS